MSTMNEAFKAWRKKKYGPHPYPVDAYTLFGVGWRAAMESAAELAENHRAGLRNGDAINACAYVRDRLLELKG